MPLLWQCLLGIVRQPARSVLAAPCCRATHSRFCWCTVYPPNAVAVHTHPAHGYVCVISVLCCCCCCCFCPAEDASILAGGGGWLWLLLVAGVSAAPAVRCYLDHLCTGWWLVCCACSALAAGGVAVLCVCLWERLLLVAPGCCSQLCDLRFLVKLPHHL